MTTTMARSTKYAVGRQGEPLIMLRFTYDILFGSKIAGLMLIALTSIGVALSGCGTVTRGISQDVTVVTTPPSATLTLSNGDTCTSPCAVNIKRLDSLKIKVTKTGCQDQTVEIPSTFPEGGTALLSLVDYQTGSAAEHRPDHVYTSLNCDSTSTVKLSPYDDNTIALLRGGQDIEEVLRPFDEGDYKRSLSWPLANPMPGPLP